MKSIKQRKSRHLLIVLLVAAGCVCGLLGKIEKVHAAAYIVNSLGDTGTGSGTTGDLRYCIAQANAAGGANTISFSVTGTINLLSALPNLSASSLTINGPGPSLLTIRRDSSVSTLRIFFMTSSGSVTLSGLTLADGNASGGGAVFKFFDGTLNIDNCVLANNAANAGGGGAIINNGNGPINITNSTISGNSANGGEGGAIRHSGTGTITISGCTFSGNSATNLACLHNNSSGTINVTNTLITGNTSIHDAGAISNSAGSVNVTGCTITNNIISGAGGAFVNQSSGTITVTETTISGNSSGIGGCIYTNLGTVNVVRCTLSNNNAGGGGVVFHNGTGTVNVTNSTISGNHASGGGGAFVFSNGAGNGQAIITSSTITGNTASAGGGITVVSGPVVTLKNTILAGNTANNGVNDFSGTLTSGGYNLIGNNAGGTITPTTGDQIGTAASPINPMLDTLKNNGGPTFTRALLAGSPAIDKGNAFTLTTDQRGTASARTYDDPLINNASNGDGTDIGAYESQPTVPTAVELIDFTAQSDPSGKVYLQWQTGYEVDNLGFNLYRDAGGKRERINPSLVAGSALLAGANVQLTAGLAYAWSDQVRTGKQIAHYWLEDVDLHGKSTWHGPVSAIPVDQLPPQADALLLSHLVAPTPASAQSLVISPSGSARGGKSSSGVSTASLQAQWDVAATPGVKLLVRQTGWYRVSQSELVAAGLDPARDPLFLKLFADGREVPIRVNGGASGRLEPNDSIEFYGQGLDAPASDVRTYYLLSSSTPGLRVMLAGAASGMPNQAPSFPLTIERKDRLVYYAGVQNGEAENWFGPIITATPATQSLNVTRLAAGNARLEIALQGVTDNLTQQPDHQVRVLLNGTDIGMITFDGKQHPVAEFELSNGQLQPGNNVITLTADSGSNDISLVDYVRLTYPHQFTADGDGLPFTTEGRVAARISGFSASNLRVLDVTDATRPLELTGQVAVDGNGYAITAAAPDSGPRTLYAFADSQVLHPARILANQPSSWNRTGQGADVLIITHRDFKDSLDALVGWRKGQGYSVAVVDTEDLYDEFSYGAQTGQAIADFLRRAKTMWKKAPRYVLLVGDASNDPRDYLGMGNHDFVPTKTVATSSLEAPSDDALADFNDDGIAELGVGRLPVRTAAEAAMVVAKIVDYERSQVVEGTIIIADRNDGFDFEGASRTIESLLPSGEARKEIFRSQMADSVASQTIIEAINRGPRVVNYAGHGSLGLWRGNLLTNASAAQLTNRQALSLFISMTCLNGLFNDAYIDSLGEALLKAEGGGAIAVWASSALTDANRQALMNQEAIRQLSNSTPKTLGDAMRAAKQAVPDGEVRRSWNLLGDPLTRLR